MQRTGKDQPCGQVSRRAGLTLPLFIICSALPKLLSLIRVSVGRAESTWVSLLHSVLAVRDFSSNFKGRPQGGTRARAPGQLPTPPTPSSQPGASAQALQPSYLLRLQVQTALIPESLATLGRRAGEASSLLEALEKS